ncbi:Uma2 family endonuclease [Nibrella saemangeumensis]
MAVVTAESPDQRRSDIPPSLIYEELNGTVLYRKGYRDVLAQTKTVDEVMGSSSLQSAIITLILLEIGKTLTEEYFIVSNEPGLHLAPNNNLSNDIAIFTLTEISQFDKKYFSVAPRYVIEVDVKADINPQEFGSEEDYIFYKTQMLLDFGVEQVIWITSDKSRKILIARQGVDWVVTNWESVVEFGPGCRFSLQGLLQKRGIAGLLS